MSAIDGLLALGGDMSPAERLYALIGARHIGDDASVLELTAAADLLELGGTLVAAADLVLELTALVVRAGRVVDLNELPELDEATRVAAVRAMLVTLAGS
jgi:hypothetical protein